MAILDDELTHLIGEKLIIRNGHDIQIPSVGIILLATAVIFTTILQQGSGDLSLVALLASLLPQPLRLRLPAAGLSLPSQSCLHAPPPPPPSAPPMASYAMPLMMPMPPMMPLVPAAYAAAPPAKPPSPLAAMSTYSCGTRRVVRKFKKH